MAVAVAGSVCCSGVAVAAGGGKRAVRKTTLRRGAAAVSPGSGGAGLGAPLDPGTSGAPGEPAVGGLPAVGGVPAAPGVSVSTPARPVVQGLTARIIHGVAYAPSDAPIQVQRAIWAGNAIRHKPYVYGGGHGVWHDFGYDCSGSVSYVLHAAGLIKVSMDSSEYMSWGESGLGQWITVYSNPGHAFVEIAGIRLDTSDEGDPHPAPGSGPRWRPLMKSTGGYTATHPANF